MSSRRRSSANARNWPRRTANDTTVLPTAAVPLLCHVFRGACIVLAGHSERRCGGGQDRRDEEAGGIGAAIVLVADGAGCGNAVSGDWILRAQLRLAGAGHRQRARGLCVSSGSLAGRSCLDGRAAERTAIGCADRTIHPSLSE